MDNTAFEKRCFPICNFPVVDADDIAALILRRLSDCEPTSVLRLGDGEGMVLAEPTPEDSTLWTRVRWHFGPYVTGRQIEGLAQKLSAAIRSADVVGIRDDLVGVDFPPEYMHLRREEFLRIFKASFGLRPPEMNIGYSGALRLALLHRYLSKERFRPEVVFGSAWLHYELSMRGALLDMMRSRSRIGLISCRPELAKQLERKLRIKVDYYRVPDFYGVAGKKTRAHFPGEFDSIMKTLKVFQRGQLFFVGAGVCGKIYCHRISELGGVAVDIGSVCDAWMDIPTRPLVLMSLFNSPPDKVPEGLLLCNQTVQALLPVCRDRKPTVAEVKTLDQC